MSITERDRRDLFDRLEENLGPQPAETLMELLPHQPADELVTISYFQTEMAASRVDINREMADLRTELKTEMADLRTELKTEMADLRTEMADLRTELKTEMADLRSEVRKDIAALDAKFTRLWSGTAAANAVAVVTALLT